MGRRHFDPAARDVVNVLVVDGQIVGTTPKFRDDASPSLIALSEIA